MAYMSQERKAEITTRIKPILKKYGIKGTLRVRNHSTIVLTIQSGPIDFIGNYAAIASKRSSEPSRVAASAIERGNMDVNPYWYHEHFDGIALEFMTEAFSALNLEGSDDANFNKSDLQSDYHHVGWYVDIDVGRWNKRYELTSPATAAAA